jgi:sigma-B regulation protein RsbU (phosphoserine phosphatase)
MAMSMTLLKATAREGFSPEKILSRVNDELSRDNDVNMFVTVFCGILDIATGEVAFANAGHNYPLVMKPDDVTWLKTVNGPALGVLEGAAYRLESLTLGRGETLFLYTDGVTEAMNAGEELFGDERLLQCLRSFPGTSPREVTETVIETVRNFAAGAPQSDDITVMALEYTGLQGRGLPRPPHNPGITE